MKKRGRFWGRTILPGAKLTRLPILCCCRSRYGRCRRVKVNSTFSENSAYPPREEPKCFSRGCSAFEAHRRQLKRSCTRVRAEQPRENHFGSSRGGYAEFSL